METSLENHKYCCRCCSKLLKTGQKTVNITKSIEKRFFLLSGMHLIMAEYYSNVICESCNSKLSEFSDFRNEICEYQTKLYAYNYVATEPEQEEENNIEIPMHEYEEENLLKSKSESKEEKHVISYEHNENDEIIQTIEEKPKIEKYCNMCDKYYPAKSYYQHKMRQHNLGFEFLCDLDNKAFKLKNDLREHMKMHINLENRQKFYCKTCHSSFLSTAALKNHENYFHSEYIEEHPCDQCGKVFPSRMKILQHIKNVHQGGTFPCPECQRTYATPASLKKHMIKSHCQKEPCNICQKLFAMGTSMNQHMKTHSKPQYRCEYENCEKEFYTKTALSNHHETHQSREPVKCPDCEAFFPSHRHLIRHRKRQHTTMRVQCEVANCYHSASRKDYLVKHYNTHKELDEATRQLLISRVKDMKALVW